ncbi:MAG TPA: hypothetical protein VK963_02915 [Candidatus Saccharimonadales bacterium]|nr:hypothetical protein [Candidatus Saccharimonadales bacterium]
MKAAEDIDQPALPITLQTKLLSIDIESNGLHGKAFAIGAVVMRLDGTVIDEFSARCSIAGELDPWVEKHVLPVLGEFPQTHRSARVMRDDFWSWYKQAKDQADYMMVDNGYPVEARFLISCQDDDIDERYWDHFFPLLDLSSMLLQVGVKPLAVRYRFVADQLGDEPILQHNPRWDAWVSALAAAKALKMSGRLA